MEKKCYTCGEIKTTADFNKNKVRKDGLNSICRACSKARSKRYYRENHDHHIKQCAKIKKKRIDANQRRMFEYLLEHPCVDCGETDPLVLEFDHLPGTNKKGLVGQLVGGGYSWETIQKEIDKCEVVCANDHRRRTYKRKPIYKNKLLEQIKVDRQGIEP